MLNCELRPRAPLLCPTSRQGWLCQSGFRDEELQCLPIVCSPPIRNQRKAPRRAITSCLRKVTSAGRSAGRAVLVDEIDHFVKWLYEDHKKVARQIRSFKATLDR